MENGMKVRRKKIAKKTAKRRVAVTAKKAPKAAPKRAASAKTPLSNGGPITWNFKLIAHHLLDGFGGMGEGMSIQIARGGRRVRSGSTCLRPCRRSRRAGDGR